METFQYTRHVFGAKDSPACANHALQQTALDRKSAFPAACAVALRDFYMDDLLHAAKSETDALSLGQDLIKMCAKGGFKLTQWLSNAPQVAQSLNLACGNVASEPPPASPVVLSGARRARSWP